MQSKTSFFNQTLYCQSLRLTLPVGIAMVVTWLLSYTMPLFNDLYGSYNGWKTTDDLTYLLWNSSDNALMTIPVTGVIFGILLAATLFSYLNTPRSINMFHALPLRREGLFLTQFAVGVTYIVATMGITALSVVTLQASSGMVCWELIFTWLWMAILTTVFFFAFAVFCMLFSGVTWMGVAYYAIFNAVTITLYSMMQGLQQAFFYGNSYFTIPRWVDWCTPVINLQSSLCLQWDGTWVDNERVSLTDYTIYGQSTVLWYGLVAVAFVIAALAVYRHRPSESASDVVAIAWAKPLFRFAMGLCSGLIFGFGLYLIVWDGFSTINIDAKLAIAMACMAVVSLVGLVVAEMLMEKTMRIGWKWLKAGAVLTVLFVALGLGMHLDVMGTEAYVPDVEDVGQVTVRMYGNGVNPANMFSDPADIAKVVAMHQAIVDDKDRQQDTAFTNYVDGYVSVTLYYYEDTDDALPICYRSYPICYAPEELDGASPLMSSIQTVLELPQMQYAGIWQTADMTDEVGSIELELFDQNGDYQYTYQMTQAETETVYTALKADAAAGHLATMTLDPYWQDDGYYNNLSMELFSEEVYFEGNVEKTETYSTWCHVPLNPTMTHTIAAVEALDAVREYPLVLMQP